MHSDEGTHKLELPVSRTTLKVCGGVPREISEKSSVDEQLSQNAAERMLSTERTLRIQEVADRHRVGAVGNVWRLEDLLYMRFGLQTHVLLAERSDLLLDIGMLLS